MKHNINLQVGVKTFIYNKEGRMLVLKRNNLKYHAVTNLWDIAGGRIDSGIDLISNLKREVLEETYLKIKDSVLLSAQDILRPEMHIVRLTYLSRVTFCNVRLSSEHVEFRWLHIEDMFKIKGLDTYVKAILKDKKQMSFIKQVLNSQKQGLRLLKDAIDNDRK